jgi:prepilin-type N-terminal cleavage/methylation domain-containing protein
MKPFAESCFNEWAWTPETAMVASNCWARDLPDTEVQADLTRGGEMTVPRMQRGVTLIELLIVLAIMMLLVTILLPSFARAREATRRTVCVSQLKQIGTGLFSYAFENDNTAPPVMGRIGSIAPRTLLSRSGEYVNLGLLMAQKSLADPRAFYCPSQTQFSYASNPEYLPAATIAGSYAYAVHKPAGHGTPMGTVRHLALISDDFVARLGAVAGIGRESHRVGYNVLYTDGSGSWNPDRDESIWNRAVHWDDETDDINYDTLYRKRNPSEDEGQYGAALDIFRVWWSFCYKQPDTYDVEEPSDDDPT